MNKTWTTLAIVALAAIGFSTTVDDEVEWKNWGDDPMSNPEFMAEWMRLAQPGEQHAFFEQAAGDYIVEGQHWMAPGVEGEKMMATSTISTLLGGRLMMEEFESKFMGGFEGLLLMGYDNMRGEYYSYWFDTMSTWPSRMHGNADADGNMNLQGEMHDLMTPGGRPFRSEHIHHEDGSFTMKMYDTLPDGEEFQNMELVYRKK